MDPLEQPDIIARLESLENKIDRMQQTMDSLRRYFKISMIITIVFFVLPIIIAVIAIPFMISTISGVYSMSGLEGL